MLKIYLTVNKETYTDRILGAMYILLFLLMSPINTMAGILGENITPYVAVNSTFDSNLFRLSENENLFGIDQRSDILVRTELGLVADIPIEKQKVFADLNINYNQYLENSFLDYTGGHAKTRWDWEIGDRLSGRVGYNFRRFLTSFSNFRTPTRDLSEVHNAYGEFGYHFHPSWEVVGGISYLDLNHSTESRRLSDRRTYTYKGELRHRNAAGNFLGIELAVIDADFPNRNAGQNSQFARAYMQYRPSLTVDWQLTGKSKVKGRLGYTIHESEPDSARDFGRLTWRLDYRWQATGKTRFELATWRAIRPFDDPVASFVEDIGVSFSPVWEPTSKINVRSDFSYTNRDFSGNIGSVSAQNDRADDIYTVGLGIGYRPIRQVQFEVVYEYQNRRSTRDLLDYFYHTVSGVIQIDF